MLFGLFTKKKIEIISCLQRETQVPDLRRQFDRLLLLQLLQEVSFDAGPAEVQDILVRWSDDVISESDVPEAGDQTQIDRKFIKQILV